MVQINCGNWIKFMRMLDNAALAGEGAGGRILCAFYV